jgi:hypothetical protein
MSTSQQQIAFGSVDSPEVKKEPIEPSSKAVGFVVESEPKTRTRSFVGLLVGALQLHEESDAWVATRLDEPTKENWMEFIKESHRLHVASAWADIVKFDYNIFEIMKHDIARVKFAHIVAYYVAMNKVAGKGTYQQHSGNVHTRYLYEKAIDYFRDSATTM